MEIKDRKVTLSNIVFILVLITYASGNLSTYVGWIVGFIALLFSMVMIFVTLQIDKESIKSLFIKNAYLLWSLIGIGYWIDVVDGIRFTLIAIFYSLISIFILKSYNSFDLAKLCKSMFTASVIWGVVNTIIFLLFLFGLVQYDNNDFAGVFVNRNQFALVSVFFMCFIYLLMIKEGFKLRYLSCCILMISFVIATKSIKGFISIALFLFIMNSYKLSIKKIILLLVFFIFLYFVLFTDNPISERLSLFIDSYNNSAQLSISSSPYLRLWLLDNGVSLVSNHPLLGVGVNQSIHYLIPEWYQLWFEQGKMDQLVGLYSHNNFLETALNGGILCVLMYYLPFVLVFTKLSILKFHKGEKEFFYAIVLIRLFSDWGSVSYYDFLNIFWIMLIFKFVLFRNTIKLN
ncbi:O-antigen ligase family protein [Vibrio fluvialis]|nr:O-antigen ligase family protein [Vibrio fluvialis]